MTESDMTEDGENNKQFQKVNQMKMRRQQTINNVDSTKKQKVAKRPQMRWKVREKVKM